MNYPKKPVVAIDGPAGVGKSTAASMVAKLKNFKLLNTGALYRAVALLAEQKNISLNNGTMMATVLNNHKIKFDKNGSLFIDDKLQEDSIRCEKISNAASIVAGHKEVRDSLLEIQRKFGKDGGVVLEGRDIGTVVFPDAEVKFFLTASVETRAKRRFGEMKNIKDALSYEQIKSQIEKRDALDKNRPISPLVMAQDAILIKSDNMTARQVAQKMVDLINT